MKKLLAFAVGLALMVGCASFSTNTFRTEQTAVNLAYTAYVGYTQALLQGTLKLTPDQSNAVKVARLKFAATVTTLESWRAAYETNSSVQPQVEAALTAVQADSSNIVWLISYLRQQ